MNVRCVFSLSKGFIQQAFLKAFQLCLHDEYVHCDTSLLSSSMDVVCQVSKPYVGDKAYIWGSTVYADGVPMCTHRNLYVAVDMETRKPKSLNPDWRDKTLRHIQANGWSNEPMQLPKFEIKSEMIYAFTMTVQSRHVDYNGHANYKIYAFGGIVCIREAIASGKLSRFNTHAPADVIPRDLCVVFVKECSIDADICFKLFDSADDTYMVGCFDGDALLAFGEYRLVTVKKESKSKVYYSYDVI